MILVVEHEPTAPAAWGPGGISAHRMPVVVRGRSGVLCVVEEHSQRGFARLDDGCSGWFPLGEVVIP